jgi:predicted amidohydrolase YtcJ
MIPKPTLQQVEDALMKAQEKCFAVGLTTVSDAGLEKSVVDEIDSLQKKGKLKMRVYAMLTDNDENRDYYFKHGIYKTDRLNVRAFKFTQMGPLAHAGHCC